MCHPVEDFNLQQGICSIDFDKFDLSPKSASASTKQKLVDLITQYEDTFSQHLLDCGEAKGIVHRIQLTDDRPLPYAI